MVTPRLLIVICGPASKRGYAEAAEKLHLPGVLECELLQVSDMANSGIS